MTKLIHDPKQVRLGKHLGVVVDARTRQFARYLDAAALPSVPQSFEIPNLPQTWQMLGNDRYGDCTCATVGHRRAAWTASAQGKESDLTEDQVLAAYAAITGFDPTTGANDNGAYELDVLNYWHRTGIGGDKIEAFAAVDPKAHDHVKISTEMFGGLYIGAALPVDAQRQDVWDVADPSLQGNSAPGSWGGHAFGSIAFDQGGVDFVTWAQRKRMTWAWWDAYVQECYLVLDRDWLKKYRTPNHFSLGELRRDVAALKA